MNTDFLINYTKLDNIYITKDLWRCIFTHISYFDLCYIRLVCRYFCGLWDWEKWQRIKTNYLLLLKLDPKIIARLYSNKYFLHFLNKNDKTKYKCRGLLKPISEDNKSLHNYFTNEINNINITITIFTYLNTVYGIGSFNIDLLLKCYHKTHNPIFINNLNQSYIIRSDYCTEFVWHYLLKNTDIANLYKLVVDYENENLFLFILHYYQSFKLDKNLKYGLTYIARCHPKFLLSLLKQKQLPSALIELEKPDCQRLWLHYYQYNLWPNTLIFDLPLPEITIELLNEQNYTKITNKCDSINIWVKINKNN